MKDSKNIFKKRGLIAAGLCAACCLLPIAAVTFGTGVLTVIDAYIEWVGIVVTLLALLFFGIYCFRKRQAPACDIDCVCKDDKPDAKGSRRV